MVIKFMEVPDLEMLEYRVRNGENLDRETILRVIQIGITLPAISEF